MFRVGQTLALAAAVVSLLAASCGDDNAAPPPPALGDAFPVTIQTGEGRVEIPTRPRSIVSISPTGTEMLFAIGAGDQVIAVDDFSNHPPGAPMTDLSANEPNVEAILSYSPDLVVFAGDPGDVAASLEAVGVPALLQPPAVDLDDAYTQIEMLGRATGHADEAQALVQRMRQRIDEIVGSAAVQTPAPSFYYELDDTYFSVTSETFIGQLFALLELRNIADAAKGGAGGYPQLSAEYIVESDPDLIFLADTECCGQSAATVARRPGWERITAVREAAIVELDDDVASRWGPRIIELLETIAKAVSSQPVAA